MNFSRAARQYAQIYSDRQGFDKNMFQRVDQRLHVKGCLKPHMFNRDYGLTRTLRNPETDGAVLEVANEQLEISIINKNRSCRHWSYISS